MSRQHRNTGESQEHVIINEEPKSQRQGLGSQELSTTFTGYFYTLQFIVVLFSTYAS